MNDPQTGEQYQSSSCTIVKVLKPISGFPAWRSNKGSRKSLAIWPWGPVGFDHRTSWGLRERQRWGHNQKFCMYHDPEEKSSDPTGDWTKTACQCWRASCGGMHQVWLTTGRGHWKVPFGVNPLGGHHQPYHRAWHRAVLPQDKQLPGRECNPTHWQINGFKLYWERPCPPEQDPVPPRNYKSGEKTAITIGGNNTKWSN